MTTKTKKLLRDLGEEAKQFSSKERQELAQQLKALANELSYELPIQVLSPRR